jgi:hypothetical protein
MGNGGEEQATATTDIKLLGMQLCTELPDCLIYINYVIVLFGLSPGGHRREHAVYI